MVKEALKALFENTDFASLSEHLDQLARDVAENREWAGVHYASDSALGKELATLIWKHESQVFGELLKEAKAEWV